MTLDLRKLEHLVAVAEEGGFTRAAGRLHMSQQALSTSVRTLERQVGVRLLERGHQRVVPTPAGRALVEDARALSTQARAALDRARRVGRDERELLRIGHTPAVTAEEVVGLLTGARVEDHGVHTQVRQFFPDELRERLRRGELDVGLSRAMSVDPGLARAQVASHRLRLAVPSGHRLADRDQVTLADLRGERVMVWGHPGTSGYTDLLLGLCRQAGVEPRVERNPVQGTPPLTAVVGGQHVAFVTDPAGEALGGRVRVLDLEPTVLVPVLALWPSRLPSPGRDLFLAHTAPERE
ncbi:LysR substrate-binding domain-containing protein [Streptomyces sp. NPDC005438]|uniref:LysR substrate-binding domain-containing protein n=1 Tax=Streptomyces sp. NPDC005438 TaxID=3156880 RepID=UPI0033B7D787